eukprot:9470980-Pyramimonas_sp.AAC.1
MSIPPPEEAPEAPRGPQEAPRDHQETPERPKGPQDCPFMKPPKLRQRGPGRLPTTLQHIYKRRHTHNAGNDVFHNDANVSIRDADCYPPPHDVPR